MQFGRLSLTEDGKTLLLNNIPIVAGQVVIAKHGKGEPLPGRVGYRQKTGWCLIHEEFIGHPYLDAPLCEGFFDNLLIAFPEESK